MKRVIVRLVLLVDFFYCLVTEGASTPKLNNIWKLNNLFHLALVACSLCGFEMFVSKLLSFYLHIVVLIKRRNFSERSMLLWRKKILVSRRILIYCVTVLSCRTTDNIEYYTLQICLPIFSYSYTHYSVLCTHCNTGKAATKCTSDMFRLVCTVNVIPYLWNVFVDCSCAHKLLVFYTVLFFICTLDKLDVV